MKFPSAWQTVLMGEGQAYRPAAAEAINRKSGPRAATRYALCGRGDLMALEKGAAHICPRGCGSRACPRCSRRAARPVARRVLQWMSRAPHDALVHLTLTQVVIPGESLADARKRFLVREKVMQRRLKTVPVSAGLFTTHVVWSEAGRGWHYHMHCLLEVPDATPLDSLVAHWHASCGADGRVDGRAHARLVSGSGPAIGELSADSGEPDLWSEAPSPIAQAIQYPLRDALQGVSAWRLGGPAQMSIAIAELIETSKGWQLHRTTGKWRKPPPAAPEAEKKEDAVSEAPAVPKVRIGTPDQVLRLARSGQREAREALLLLERSANNVSDFAKRLVWFCALWRAP